MRYYKFAIYFLLFITTSLFSLENMEKEDIMEKDLSPQLHHYLGIEMNMQTWNLIEKADRTAQDNNRMIAFAKASNYHWYKSPEWKPINEQRGFWLIARVYTILEVKEKAIEYAEKCLKLTQELDLKDFDLGYAYEAMARANALNNNEENYLKYKKLAIEASENIKENEDKKYFMMDFEKGPWFEFDKK